MIITQIALVIVLYQVPQILQDGDWNSAAYYLLLRGVGSSAL